MSSLPDPRRYRPGVPTHPLVQCAAAVIAADAVMRGARFKTLQEQLVAHLEHGRAIEMRRALEEAPDALHYRTLFDALAAVADAPIGDADAIVLRTFALPLVFVAAAGRRATIAGVLPDLAGIEQLFGKSGVLGGLRNFGLSGALCSLETLAGLDSGEIFRVTRSLDGRELLAALTPAPIDISPGREQAHLRFLIGAGVSPASAPDFSETAGNIGAWGRDLGNLLRKQLAEPDLQLLVLPRPPQSLMRAPHAGRTAQLDVALHLFISNTVRRFRMSCGEPVAILSTHDNGELRVTLSSLFADDVVEAFCWPLASLDDLDAIQREIVALLHAVRVDDVRVARAIMPARRSSGGDWHPRVGEWDALEAAAERH